MLEQTSHFLGNDAGNIVKVQTILRSLYFYEQIASNPRMLTDYSRMGINLFMFTIIYLPTYLPFYLPTYLPTSKNAKDVWRLL